MKNLCNTGNKIKWIFFCSSLLFVVHIIAQETEQWASNGPTGAYIYVIEEDPSDSLIIYLGSYNWGLYKTIDGGINWFPINNGYPINPDFPYHHWYGGGIYFQPNVIRVNPQNSQIIYVGTKEAGLYKSTNGGSSWFSANNGLPDDARIDDLEIDPIHTDTVYVAEGFREGAVYRSNDGGDTWVRKDSNVVDEYYKTAHSILIHPDSSNILYFGGARIYKSINYGESWEDLTGFYYINYELVMDPYEPLKLYGIFYTMEMDFLPFKSTDGGLTWFSISPNTQFTRTLILEYTTPKILFLFDGGHNNISKSYDDGETWSSVGPIDSLSINPTGIWAGHTVPKRLYVSSLNGFYTSYDRGITWSKRNQGLMNCRINSLVIDPTDNNILYAGTGGSGVFKSIDGAESWTEINIYNIHNDFVNILAFDPVNPGIIYQGGNRIYKSTSAGNFWVEIASFSYSIVDIVINPLNPDIIYANGYRSNDGGLFWHYLGIPSILIEDIELSPDDTAEVYYVLRDSVIKSTNGGESWTNIFDREYWGGWGITHIKIDEDYPDNILLGTSNGLYFSSNRGVSWEKIDGVLADLHITAIAFDPLNQDVWYIGTKEGIYRGADNGSNWWKIPSNGLLDETITDIVLDRLNPQTIYVGTRSTGVYKYTFDTVGIDNNDASQNNKPQFFSIKQNYPNPFNMETVIQYTVLNESNNVTINVYNLFGTNVITLVNEKQSKGQHQIVWNGRNEMDRDVGSGIYFIVMTVGNISETKKAVLIH